MSKLLGEVFTSSEIADFICKWAVTSKFDEILDLGFGEGAFVFASYKRLTYLGNTSQKSLKQIYGSEIDRDRFNNFQRIAQNENLAFPNLFNEDFFQSSPPSVNAVVGNPPYVRRRKIDPKTIENIREDVLLTNPSISESNLSQLSDLYIYFLLKGCVYIKSGGKLAVIIPDSWLNARYGTIFRDYLVKNFKIEHIISFDKSLFEDAAVKPIILFATKERNENYTIQFSSIEKEPNFDEIYSILNESITPNIKQINVTKVPITKLKESSSWGVFLKHSKLIEKVVDSSKTVPLSIVASSRIGLQTLAKQFFVFSPEEVDTLKIEEEYLAPMIHSISDFSGRVVEETQAPFQYLFFCSKNKSALQGSKALAYITDGEETQVLIRGRDTPITGYNNKPRIKKARRPNWYDVKTAVQSRGRAPILMPRLIYSDYRVIWNVAQFVPGGALIEIFPKKLDLDHRLLLSLLNSSLTEFYLRSISQMYGDGLSTVSVSSIKNLPIIDIDQINEDQKAGLIEAYETYLVTGIRTDIDKIILNILNLDKALLYKSLDQLQKKSTTS